MCSSKITIEYPQPGISFTFTYVITNKTLLILSIFLYTLIAIFSPQNTHVVWKIEIITAIVSQNSKFFYITITMDISFIYNSKDKVSEREIDELNCGIRGTNT